MAWTKAETEQKDVLFGKCIGLIGSSSIDVSRAGTNFMEAIYIRTGALMLNYATFGSYLTAQVEDYASEQTNQLRMLDTMPSTGIDMVLVNPGLNDDTNGRPLGTWEGTSYTEFYYCLHEMCKKLYAKYPTIPFGVLTGHYYGNQTARSSVYHNAIKEVCAYYNVPVCDLRTEGQTPYNIATWKSAHTTDTLHLNNAGYEILSRRVETFMRSILAYQA